MSLFARVVSRRVRALEAALDSQRAQTLAWHSLCDAASNRSIRATKERQEALDDLAKARADHGRLVKELDQCWVVRARIATERSKALREADLLRDKVAVPDVRYPLETPAYEDALTVALRRARQAEANCLRLENHLAVCQGRPVVGVLR